jgi:RNA polymerase sigma-70 factor (ECF subfamily)
VPTATAPRKADEPADAALVARIRGPAADAEAAFRALHDRHKDEVFSFLVHMLRDDPLAEDALQETFLRVYRAIDSYDPERAFRPWLYQIARNVALDTLRLLKKADRLEAVSAEGARRGANRADPVVPEVERRESVERARAALEVLAPEARALLVQRHGLDMKIAELAESWSITEKTVTARLRAAAAKLAEVLSKPGSQGGGT